MTSNAVLQHLPYINRASGYVMAYQSTRRVFADWQTLAIDTQNANANPLE